MVDSYVTKAELENNKIVLTVQVADFQAGGAVEISGQVTQYQAPNDAVIVTFYKVQDLPGPASSAPNAPNAPNVPKDLPVTVDLGDTKFDPAQEVTVVARVARVWVTVLEPGSSDKEHVAWTAKAAASPAPPNGGSRSW